MATPERAMSWMKVLRPQDVLLLVLFAGVAAASPTRDAHEIALLLALAAVQIAGPKLPRLGTEPGKVLW
ncbi:MAG TPA: hypothetical protein VEK14_01320, partial [Rhodomicrobium sp.]|nr:hypothetical protein [Rhodomicrobium sp.]